MTNPQPPHFIIEEGPERGREITIPPEGARLGRATENDISIADAAMSRFQCRIYFRDGFLHVMDLGSTNETLLNDEPVVDQALRHGDQILIGESLLRVVNDGLAGTAPPPKVSEEPAAAPIVFLSGDAPKEPEPAPVPIPEEPAAKAAAPDSLLALKEESVDLGLGRKEEDEGEQRSEASKTNYLLITLVTVLVVMVVGVAVHMLTPRPETTETVSDVEDFIQVSFERIVSGDGNIFRYAVDIRPDGQIYAEIHDVANERTIIREHQMSPEMHERFRTQIANRRDSFVRLRDVYEGVPLDEHESMDLMVIFGRNVKQVRVANQLEPDAFRSVRDQIESFVENELNLGAIQHPPEVLRAMADRAWENALKLYEEREVRNSNLWDATQQLREVTWLLEMIEPKPAYFRDAVRLRQEWRAQLEQRVRDMRFEAAREQEVGNRERAAEIYRRILATFPERSHSLHEMTLNNLIQLEQEMRR